MQVLPVQALCVLGNTLVAYKRGSLYAFEFRPGQPLTGKRLLCKVPMSPALRLAAHLPVLYRILRTVPRAAAAVSEHEFVFAFSGRIFRVDIRAGEIVAEHTFREPMRAPLSFATVQNVPNFSDTLLYGEYHGNLDSGEMCVYTRSEAGEWKPCYTFPAGNICHIHGFCPDPENKRVLILVGDTDEQSAIYAAKDDFRRVDKLLGGSQQYRSCVAFPHKGGVIYATDTPLAPNALYVYDGSDQPRKVYELPGPSIFGVQTGDRYWFATSVEPDSRLPWKRYLFTRRLGEGVAERYVHIVCGNPDTGFRTVLRIKKDALPMTLCQFGNAAFVPYGDGVLIVPQSVCRYEGKTIYMERTTE